MRIFFDMLMTPQHPQHLPKLVPIDILEYYSIAAGKAFHVSVQYTFIVCCQVTSE